MVLLYLLKPLELFVIPFKTVNPESYHLIYKQHL